MRENYKLQGETKKIEVEFEKEVAEKLLKMEAHMKLSCSELANTAMKRFIAAHNDFFPRESPALKK
jgi:hypothetical protein